MAMDSDERAGGSSVVPGAQDARAPGTGAREAGGREAGAPREAAREAAPRDVGPRGWHARGYLPHYDGGAVAQFISFRLANSLPLERLQVWRDELAHLPDAEAAREQRRRIESYLDTGQGVCWLHDARIADRVAQALRHFHGDRYHLHAWVIMPNHVHVLFTPAEAVSLGNIVHSWKSYTAKEANRLLGHSGAFWQVDYFDRAIRDERHYHAVHTYIESNPTRAGLCAHDHEWPWSSASIRSAAIRSAAIRSAAILAAPRNNE